MVDIIKAIHVIAAERERHCSEHRLEQIRNPRLPVCCIGRGQTAATGAANVRQSRIILHSHTACCMQAACLDRALLRIQTGVRAVQRIKSCRHKDQNACDIECVVCPPEVKHPAGYRPDAEDSGSKNAWRKHRLADAPHRRPRRLSVPRTEQTLLQNKVDAGAEQQNGSGCEQRSTHPERLRVGHRRHDKIAGDPGIDILCAIIDSRVRAFPKRMIKRVLQPAAVLLRRRFKTGNDRSAAGFHPAPAVLRQEAGCDCSDILATRLGIHIHPRADPAVLLRKQDTLPRNQGHAPVILNPVQQKLGIRRACAVFCSLEIKGQRL